MGYCKYVNEGLKAQLETHLKTHTLKDTKTHIAITSCMMNDSDRPYGHVFTKNPKNEEELDYPLVNIALATSAAPTFFPEVEFGRKKWVDGGVIANNPSLLAHAVASEHVDNPSTDILHISLGTGYSGTEKIEHDAREENKLWWGLNLSTVCTDGQSRMIRDMTSRFYKSDVQRYYRFEPKFEKEVIMDDYARAQELVDGAQALIVKKQAQFDAVIEILARKFTTS